MHYYRQNILLLLRRLALVLLVFQLCRLIFLISNFSWFHAGLWETVQAFFWGIRFDLWSVLLFNLPVIFMVLIPGGFKYNRGYQKTVFILFLIFNAVPLLANLVDTEYFKFTNKRSTSDLLDLITTGSDTLSLLPQFLADFWYIVLIWVSFMTGLWYFGRSRKMNSVRTQFKWRNILLQSLILILAHGSIFVVLRGTAERPVSMLTAANYVNSGEVPLVLNTPFTILITLQMEALEKKVYFENGEQSRYFDPVYSINGDPNRKRKNVVIIILESFSTENIGYYSPQRPFTPFLDSLLRESLVFQPAYANSRKSIECLPAILAGIPNLMETPYVQSPYSSNRMYGLPKVLSENGYHTSFFHGGQNGTMGFDDFAYMAGIKEYYGKNEYPDQNDFDGNWGIWDEPYFLYFASKLSTFKEPFFTVLYTLSSHHPYTIPEKYRNVLPEGENELHKSIAYTDKALQNFFKKAKELPWYYNTVFVITADHTFWSTNPFYTNRVGMFRVPLAFYAPGDSLFKGCIHKTCQHLDIGPTLLDVLGIQSTMVSFGSSLFDTSSTRYSLNYINGNYQLVYDNMLLLHDGRKSVALYDLRTDSMLFYNIVDTDVSGMENFLKAVLQEYSIRIIENRITP